MGMLANLGTTAVPDIAPDAADRSAELDIVTLDELAAMPTHQRMAKLRSMAEGLFGAAAIASFLMDRDRAAVVTQQQLIPRQFTRRNTSEIPCRGCKFATPQLEREPSLLRHFGQIGRNSPGKTDGF